MVIVPGPIVTRRQLGLQQAAELLPVQQLVGQLPVE
jgi:hypothetical protein